MTQNTSTSPGKGNSPPSTGNKPRKTSPTKRNKKKKPKGTKPKPNKNWTTIPAFTGPCLEAEFKNSNAIVTQLNGSLGITKLEKAAKAFCVRKFIPRLSAAIEDK